ncbi:MAG: NUDIX hydrolase [Pseudomonadota bacterium]
MSADASPDRTAAPATPRDAATVVLVRRDASAPRVLMGQRGGAASFMPNKFVFPGGALDPSDFEVRSSRALSPACRTRLGKKTDRPELAAPLAFAAIRETFEETGLRLAHPAEAVDGPPEAETWRRFFSAGGEPAIDRLRFVFRAITPPTLPKRFDARFFLADAETVLGDLDDFSQADAELSHLSWLPLDEARGLDLPFITSVVLAELQALADAGWPEDDRPAPFFRHDASGSHFEPL